MEPTDRDVDGIKVVTKPSAKQLSERELHDYADHREEFLRWALNVGKEPEKAEGYSFYTIRDRAYRLAQFYRWVWNTDDRYTTNITHEHGNEYLKELAYSDRSNDDKAQHMKSLQTLFKWREWEFGEDEWEPSMTFSNDSGTANPRDYLTVDERKRIREAALEYGSVPSYSGLTADERDEWKAHLAQRFEKPKEEVGPADFEKANGWKIPSLVWTALDTGLRGIEVEKASVQWVDTENRVLRIPRDESSKNENNWTVSLTDRTANALSRWLRERDQYSKYEDTDALWLTRNGTVYQSYSLNYLLRRLCEVADIDIENRQMTWYSIRHSVGTYMTRKEGLAAAQAQLRHESEQTTMRYDQTPPSDRRDALNEMG